MLHKISDLCDKIDSIKMMSDKLRVMKYNEPKAQKHELNALIETIQADCLLVAMDKGEYWKPNNEEKVGNSIIGGTMSPEEEREWIRMEQQQDGKSTT